MSSEFEFHLEDSDAEYVNCPTCGNRRLKNQTPFEMFSKFITKSKQELVGGKLIKFEEGEEARIEQKIAKEHTIFDIKFEERLITFVFLEGENYEVCDRYGDLDHPWTGGPAYPKKITRDVFQNVCQYGCFFFGMDHEHKDQNNMALVVNGESLSRDYEFMLEVQGRAHFSIPIDEISDGEITIDPDS